MGAVMQFPAARREASARVAEIEAHIEARVVARDALTRHIKLTMAKLMPTDASEDARREADSYIDDAVRALFDQQIGALEEAHDEATTEAAGTPDQDPDWVQQVMGSLVHDVQRHTIHRACPFSPLVPGEDAEPQSPS